MRKAVSLPVLWLALAACAAGATPERALQVGAADRGGRYYLAASEVVRIRRNIGRYPWVAQAWRETKAFADERLDAGSAAPDPNQNFRDDPDWRNKLYLPGLSNGHASAALATSYLVTGDERYAQAARRVLLGWVETYNHPPGVGGGEPPGHMVAEPIGPMIKLFMTADMLRGYLSPAEWTRVQRWARQWVTRSEATADSARDHPWVPDTVVGTFRTNGATYGNSPMGQRAMAVWAAAIAGEADLRAALDWNWSHRTAGGREYGWDNVLEKMFWPRGGGETLEGHERTSLGYGLFAWGDLVLIADIAKHAGYSRNLFTSRTRTGRSLLSVGPFYGPLLAGKRRYPYSSPDTFGTKDQASVSAEYRAVFETVVANCPARDKRCAPFRAAVRAGGKGQRGKNFDHHLTRWNALRAGQW